MSVYVDDMAAAYRRMKMCHMTADSSSELLVMADRIGVARKWIQHPGTAREHFDVCQAKRALAVAAGAKEISIRDTVRLTRIKRAAGIHPEDIEPECRCYQCQKSIIKADDDAHVCIQCGGRNRRFQ